MPSAWWVLLPTDDDPGSLMARKAADQTGHPGCCRTRSSPGPGGPSRQGTKGSVDDAAQADIGARGSQESGVSDTDVNRPMNIAAPSSRGPAERRVLSVNVTRLSSKESPGACRSAISPFFDIDVRRPVARGPSGKRSVWPSRDPLVDEGSPVPGQITTHFDRPRAKTWCQVARGCAGEHTVLRPAGR